MKYLFIGPTLLAGIGQVTWQYARLVQTLGHQSTFVSFGEPVPPGSFDVGFAFVLPIQEHLRLVDTLMSRCKRKMYMTTCETETVHPQYGMLVEKYGTMWVPSRFCLEVFQRQFPNGRWNLLRHWTPTPKLLSTSTTYTFYTIGNIMDPRKNIKMLLEAFMRCQFPNAQLLLKATCKVPVDWKLPRVTIVNGLMSEEELDLRVHARGDCYVNCSHSEGVGMGAVEAALRNKPVILTDFGGLKEYVPDSPFVVSCSRTTIENDDFLFQKGMVWGQPSLEGLMTHMKTCYEQNIRTWDHPGTRACMDEVLTFFREPSPKTETETESTVPS